MGQLTLVSPMCYFELYVYRLYVASGHMVAGKSSVSKQSHNVSKSFKSQFERYIGVLRLSNIEVRKKSIPQSMPTVNGLPKRRVFLISNCL